MGEWRRFCYNNTDRPQDSGFRYRFRQSPSRPAAWNFGVASGLFTGIRHNELRRDFRIPENLKPAAVVGFGYPKKKIKGKKSRKPLEELVFVERFGAKLSPEDLS